MRKIPDSHVARLPAIIIRKRGSSIPRRLTAHYREMFGESGSHLDPSSSAPGSSGQETVSETQYPQRVFGSTSSSAPSAPHVSSPMAHPTMPPPMAIRWPPIFIPI
uniref:Uncharacterized protein n=1 Tax=Brassica oleracea var. oleracea TaxID=109376 RepID=A0A0D3AZV7_BRAOL